MIRSHTTYETLLLPGMQAKHSYVQQNFTWRNLGDSLQGHGKTGVPGMALTHYWFMCKTSKWRELQRKSNTSYDEHVSVFGIGFHFSCIRWMTIQVSDGILSCVCILATNPK